MGKDNQTPKEGFFDLARLAHDSFEQRRSYEWKMHFGLWMAIAISAYMAVKEEIIIFRSEKEAIFICSILGGIYVWHFFMVNRGHLEDKRRKHYYMAKAEGKDAAEFEKHSLKSIRLQFLWAIPYMIFTGLLICLASRLLLGVESEVLSVSAFGTDWVCGGGYGW